MTWSRIYAVIRLLLPFVQNALSLSDHVVYHVALGDLLGPELGGCGQIFTVVVAQVIVGHDRRWLEARVDEKIHDDGLELGLSRLEIVSSDENIFFFSQLNAARNKGILG